MFAYMEPAKEVGGDLYGYVFDHNKLYFAVGDVSGKGIPASLFMAVVRSLFRNISAHVASPERISYTLNNALAESNETSMFVTLFTGVLDLATGHLRYCNAGHNSPLLIGRKVGELPCLPNLPLGITTEFQFDVQEIDIDPQTTIFLFTDGLTEAENAQHDQFGDERTFQIADRMLANRQHQPQQLIQEMRQEVHRFVGDAEQSDDLTMLAVQYKPLG
jgi:sigma-B regulation protein RsbU (phosphoserine phosphatase)